MFSHQQIRLALTITSLEPELEGAGRKGEIGVLGTTGPVNPL